MAAQEGAAHLAKAGRRLASIQLQETSGPVQPADGIWAVSLSKVGPGESALLSLCALKNPQGNSYTKPTRKFIYIHVVFFPPLQRFFSLCVAAVISRAAVDCLGTPTASSMRGQLTLCSPFLLPEDTGFVSSLLCPAQS